MLCRQTRRGAIAGTGRKAPRIVAGARQPVKEQVLDRLRGYDPSRNTSRAVSLKMRRYSQSSSPSARKFSTSRAGDQSG